MLCDPMDCSTPRPPCLSPTPGVYPDSCPLSQRCHPTTSSSVVPFSSCLQSVPASESFPVNQFFTSYICICNLEHSPEFQIHKFTCLLDIYILTAVRNPSVNIVKETKLLIISLSQICSTSAIPFSVRGNSFFPFYYAKILDSPFITFSLHRTLNWLSNPVGCPLKIYPESKQFLISLATTNLVRASRMAQW